MAITLNKKKTVKSRDNFICRACGFGGSENFSGFLDLDHIIPRSAGGSDDLENLQCLCKVCNGEKGDNTKEFKIRFETVKEEIWARNQKIVRRAFEVNNMRILNKLC